MEKKYFDAHSHLNFSQFDKDREEVIKRMAEDGVWTICVGIDLKTSEEVVALAKKYENIFATIGVHPEDVGEGFDAPKYERLLSDKVVAVGECGLDYFRGGTRAQQEPVFNAQIDFAKKHKLPLMIHARPSSGSMDAYEDVLEILEASGDGIRGNVHFFVGTPEIAKRFLDLGFTLSFDGPITFSKDYDEAIRSIPQESILVETDAPFAAPEPNRGKRNEPSYVKEVAEAIARIRSESPEEVRKALFSNTCRTFGIDEESLR